MPSTKNAPLLLVGLVTVALVFVSLWAGPWWRSSEVGAPRDPVAPSYPETARVGLVDDPPEQTPRVDLDSRRSAETAPSPLLPSEKADTSVALPWEEARPLAEREAMRRFERSLPFHAQTFLLWPEELTAEGLRKMQKFGSDVDAEALAPLVDAEVADINASLRVLGDQYIAALDRAASIQLSAEPAARSRTKPVDVPAIGGHKIRVEPDAAGGWHVQYIVRSDEVAQLFEERRTLISQRNQRIREFLSRYR